VMTGFEYSKTFGRKFLNFNIFISSLRDLIKGGGGLSGIRTEMFLTESFPLTIGFGYLADFNNYSEFQKLPQYNTRTISGASIDFNYNLIYGIHNYMDLYLEYDEIYFNEEIIFTSPGMNIIEKPGASNWIFGTKIKRGSWTTNIDFEYSSKTMNSQFFNSIYDLEKARYISLHEDSTEIFNKLNNYSLNTIIDSSSYQQILIPKDVYSIYSDRLNFYDTPGFRFSLAKHFGNSGHFKFGYGLKIEKRDEQYFKILDSGSLSDDELANFEYTPKKYHSLEIKAGLGDKVIKGISGLDFFYNQYNAPTFFSFSDSSTSAEMGFNLSLRPIQFVRLIIESRMIHYDFNNDGVIENANNLNFELKFSI